MFYLIHRNEHRELRKIRGKKKKYIFQMKEQDKTPKNFLNEMEVSNLSDKEFKIMVITLLTELERRIQ